MAVETKFLSHPEIVREPASAFTLPVAAETLQPRLAHTLTASGITLRQKEVER